MKRPLLIVNPLSGGGRARRILAQLKAVVERRLGPVDLAPTARRGHAIELARTGVRDGHDLVVAVGGDGTLNEVANGVLEAGGGVAVACIGMGTGGDFARTLGLPARLDASLDAIASGKERVVDTGRVRYRAPGGREESRWFVNVVSAGLGGLVDRYVAQTTRFAGGTAAYYLASLRALARAKRARVRCEVSEGGKSSERRLVTLMIAVCNGRYFGSGMHVAPMASPDDGRFEVVSMDAPNKIAFMAFSRSIYAGRHLKAPGVQHFACDRLAMDLSDEDARGVFLLDVDGEPLGGLPVEIELVPRALRIRGA